MIEASLFKKYDIRGRAVGDDAPLTPELKADYPCWCGSKSCRGTLLSSSIEEAEAPKKRKAAKKAKA